MCPKYIQHMNWQVHWSSGTLAMLRHRSFIHDIRIHRYRLRRRSSEKMTTTSCITRYRVKHDVVYYSMSCMAISAPMSVYSDIVYWHRVRHRVRHSMNPHRVITDIVPDIVYGYIGPDVRILGYRMPTSGTTWLIFTSCICRCRTRWGPASKSGTQSGVSTSLPMQIRSEK